MKKKNKILKTIKFLPILAVLASLCGCKGLKTVVEVPVYIHDSTVAVRELHDSTYVDRWHTVYQRGDTVYVTNNQITVKHITLTDTAYKVVEKPVEVVVSQIKEVAKPLTWWQQTAMYMGIAFMFTIILFFVRFLIKRKFF